MRCAACGHSWHATPDAAKPGLTAQPAPPPAPAPAAPVQSWEPAPAADEPDRIPFQMSEEPVAAPAEAPRVAPHTEFRARREEKKRKTKLALVGGAWGITAAALVAALVAVFLLRAEVVRFWPKSASAFALVGAPVNPFGLEFEKVRLDRQVVAGAPVLSISGAVRNTTPRKQTTRPIELSLLDHKNHVVFSWTVLPEQSHLKPGEVAKFMTRIANAPVEAMQLEVTLLASAKDAKASGDSVALKRKTHGTAPAAPALAPAGDLMAGAEMGTTASEGEPFAGHGVEEAPFDPLGADAPANDAVAESPVAEPHG